MKIRLSFLLSLFLSITFFCPIALCEYQLEYTIEMYSDGSTEWFIEQRFSTGEGEPPSPQHFNTFVNNIKALVNSAKLETGRDMSADGFAMTVNVSGSYTVVKYRFHWAGFAVVETNRIRIGDVFEVDGLFLYGGGIVNIAYPAGYIVENVSPQPHTQSSQTLIWWGIEDFKPGEPKIVLAEEGLLSFVDVLKENALMIVSIIVLTSVGFTSFYHFKLKKGVKKEKTGVEPPTFSKIFEIEDSEEKIVALLKTAGGCLHQTTIANQCKFSKAKTSILLTQMEKKGTVKRHEKGREKIVTLVEGSENGESHKC